MVETAIRSNGRRTRIPDKPHHPLNLWNILKNCIGKDLSRIPLPVNFSEPLSLLQRLTEDFEYADILDRAASCEDSCEQLAWLAAFSVSCYSTTVYRTTKPFNPLLGETYECDRTADLGWRAINEQVSHHPPVMAQHCEGKTWTCWQEFSITTKFRGTYIEFIPQGTIHLQFKGSGNHYTWHKVTTVINNIVVGKLWLDQYGETDLVNHTDGSKCHLTYVPFAYFSRDVQKKVKGYVWDKDRNVKWIVSGTWDMKIEITPVNNVTGTPHNPIYGTGPSIVAWTRIEAPIDSEYYYNFTLLACQLNEMEEGVAPTDSRNRPDQRLMEEGQWTEADIEKERLEEKQRSVRKARVTGVADGHPLPPYEPVWFKQGTDLITGSFINMYCGGYWEAKQKQDWSQCPDIF